MVSLDLLFCICVYRQRQNDGSTIYIQKPENIQSLQDRSSSIQNCYLDSVCLLLKNDFTTYCLSLQIIHELIHQRQQRSLCQIKSSFVSGARWWAGGAESAQSAALCQEIPDSGKHRRNIAIGRIKSNLLVLMQIIFSDLCVPAIASLQLHRAPEAWGGGGHPFKDSQQDREPEWKVPGWGWGRPASVLPLVASWPTGGKRWRTHLLTHNAA